MSKKVAAVPNWEAQETYARTWARRDARQFFIQQSGAARCASLMDTHRFLMCGVVSWEHAPWSNQ